MDGTGRTHNRNVYATGLVLDGVWSRPRAVRQARLVPCVGVEAPQALPVCVLCPSPGKVAARTLDAGAYQVALRYTDIFNVVAVSYASKAVWPAEAACESQVGGAVTTTEP